MKKRTLLKRPPAGIGDIWLRKKKRHRIHHRVLDRVDPKTTRWMVQLPLQKNCVIGWWGLDGFTDEAAVRREWHSFEISGRANVREFLEATAPLLRRGLIEISIDGHAVRPLAEPMRPRPVSSRRSVTRDVEAVERPARATRRRAG